MKYNKIQTTQMHATRLFLLKVLVLNLIFFFEDIAKTLLALEGNVTR